MIVKSLTHETLSLRAGEILTVVADSVSSGTVNRLGDSAGDPVQSITGIAASDTTIFGPFGGTAIFDVCCGSGFLTYAVTNCTPLLQQVLNNLTGTDATSTEIDVAADLSGQGALVRTHVIPITAAPTGVEQDTGFDLPANAEVLDVLISVTAAEVTGTTKTLDVGLLTGESGGDPDGFLDGVSVASLGLKRGQATVAAGVFTANTRGVLLSDYTAGTNADDRGLYREKPHQANSITARSVTYTAGAVDFAEFRGSLILLYVEVA